jgi:heptosyltransferase-2
VIDKTRVKRILVITLSNLGDIVLTTPVVETLIREFPGRKLDIMVGPNGKEVFEFHPNINDIIIYNKTSSARDKFAFFLRLRKNRYDLVVDLRNTVLPFVLGARYTTSAFRHGNRAKMHKRDMHLSRLRDLGIDSTTANFEIHIDPEERNRIDSVIANFEKNSFIVVSPGAKSHVKRWPIKHYARLCDMIKRELDSEVVLVGDKNDSIVIERMLFSMDTNPVNLNEKLNIRELAYLIERSTLVITNDSAPLHIGSSAQSSVLAFFGPTDEKKYGPVSDRPSKVLRKSLECSPCEVAQCKRIENKYECLTSISPKEAFQAVKELVSTFHVDAKVHKN